MGKHANPRRVDIPSSTAQTQLCKERDCVCWFMTVSPTPRKVSVQSRASLDTFRGMTAWMYREKEWEMQPWQPSSPWFSHFTAWLSLHWALWDAPEPQLYFCASFFPTLILTLSYTCKQNFVLDSLITPTCTHFFFMNLLLLWKVRLNPCEHALLSF